MAPSEPLGDGLSGDPEVGGQIVHRRPTGHVEVALLQSGDQGVVLLVGEPEVAPLGGVREFVDLP